MSRVCAKFDNKVQLLRVQVQSLTKSGGLSSSSPRLPLPLPLISQHRGYRHLTCSSTSSLSRLPSSYTPTSSSTTPKTSPYSNNTKRTYSTTSNTKPNTYSKTTALNLTLATTAALSYYIYTNSTMTSKLIPQDPEKVMVIRDVTPGITTLSVPFARFGHIKIGGRATIVKLKSGGLAVFSPVALTPAVKAKLTSLGNNVSYLIAPDLEHHIFLSDWKKAYPTAKLIAPEGLEEKRNSNPETAGLKFDYIVTPQNKLNFKLPADLASEFKLEYVHSHPNKELAFLHIPSKTLIQADLIFNLPATEQYSRSPENPTTGLATKLFNAINNTNGDATGQARFIWYGPGGRDRTGFAESVKRIEAWGFERMIPCHGEVVEGDAKAVWKKVMRWFLEK